MQVVDPGALENAFDLADTKEDSVLLVIVEGRVAKYHVGGVSEYNWRVRGVMISQLYFIVD